MWLRTCCYGISKKGVALDDGHDTGNTCFG
jgi:hypothetical protein